MADEKLYVVEDGRRQTKPLSESRVHDLYLAGKITTDAVVTQVGTTFGVPVLDFFDDDEGVDRVEVLRDPVEAKKTQVPPLFVVTATGRQSKPSTPAQILSIFNKGGIESDAKVSEAHGEHSWPLASFLNHYFPGTVQESPPPIRQLSSESTAAIRTCPFCAEEIRPDAKKCRHCGEFLDPLIRMQRESSGRGQFNTKERNEPPTSISAPVLISAIACLIGALIYVGTIILIPFAVPLVIRSICDFRLYARFGKEDPAECIRSARGAAIWQIIVGLVSFLPLICGIVILINADKALMEFED